MHDVNSVFDLTTEVYRGESGEGGRRKEMQREDLNPRFVSEESFSCLVAVTAPLSLDEFGDGVCHVQPHLKARMMPQLAEHGVECRHALL